MAHLASSKVGEIFQGKMRLPNLGSILTDTGDKRAYFCSFLLLGAVLGLARLVGTPSFVSNKHVAKASKSLLAMAVGIKQKTAVDQIVEKFFSSNFTIMLFHYDDVVDEWRDLQWSGSALHVSAINQTKWWFAKLFLYPDVVAEYNYIFLWDEDLGVEHFHPGWYELSCNKCIGIIYQ
uniref:Uncharacterized protein LOC105035549 isoform X5 n=1 Tax=Elaeis guineensis var. tenera TaxID=51953 RepID=A0A6J0PD88_ELAGV|nr:uncharacterized protein LOC105035549 isoform X5 [Elaeis guineensis]